MLLADSVVWAEWSVAVGTIMLALFTAWLAWTTRRSVQAATAELRLERKRLDASQTPRVFPALPLEWALGGAPYNVDPRLWHDVLPVKNGGPGVALNVWARLEWPASGDNVRTLATSLAPGDEVDLRLDSVGAPRTDWDNVTGRLIYTDIAGTAWQTDFRFDVAAANRRRVTVGETTRVDTR
jgi:hypothetical protein